MSYKSRRNEAKHRQLALLYTLVSLTFLLALLYCGNQLATYWKAIELLRPLPAEATERPLAAIS